MESSGIFYNGDQIRTFNDEISESERLVELETHFPAIGRQIRKLYDGLFPIQYLMFQLMKGDVPDYVNPNAILIGHSLNGTGKTMAYSLPILDLALSKLQKQDDRSRPFAMIYTISRIAASSVKTQLEQLFSGTDIKIGFIYKNETYNLKASNRFDIVIYFEVYSRDRDPTSDKMNLAFLSNLKYLIIDEADEILNVRANEEFCKQVINSSKCRCFLFSATPNIPIRCFAQDFDYFKLSALNSQNAAFKFIEVDSKKIPKNVGIAKDVEYFKGSAGKLHPFDELYKILREIELGKVLIFIKKTSIAKVLAAKLVFLGFKAAAAVQPNQEQIIELFRQGKCDILIGTQAISRGLDEKIDVVINYDLPTQTVEFIHRSGRTRRGGADGEVYTFIDNRNHVDYSPEVRNELSKHFGRSL